MLVQKHTEIPTNFLKNDMTIKLNSALLLILLGVFSLGNAYTQSPEKPNILWISVEDISSNLGCYGDAFAKTPVLDKLAENGIRYTNAIASSPVCAAARSAIITGMYASSLGTQHMRCKGRMPEGFKFYPQVMQ